MTDLATAHDELRPLMFSIAYRMLGSVAEAEDVIHDKLQHLGRVGDLAALIQQARRRQEGAGR
jgi:hypothetical protein